MCVACDVRFERRRFLGLAGAALAASMLPSTGFAAGGPKTSLTADESLAKLRQGNARYVSAPQVCELDLVHSREHVAKAQAPWATIISCADSRVPPELLFGGQGLGDLFVARNAGNMVDTATMGTIEYGASVLGVPLIVVLGHARCGAVAAACEIVEKNATFPRLHRADGPGHRAGRAGRAGCPRRLRRQRRARERQAHRLPDRSREFDRLGAGQGREGPGRGRPLRSR